MLSIVEKHATNNISKCTKCLCDIYAVIDMFCMHANVYCLITGLISILFIYLLLSEVVNKDE